MWRTRVGYAGGTKVAPTYRDMGDHTECFQVDFDPRVISYAALLGRVWADHDPTAKAYSVQYASLVLAHDDEQLRIAQECAARQQALVDRPMRTRIELLDRFWVAEDYHQKYYLRQSPARMAEFRAAFGADESAFRESTAAARANALAARGINCSS